MIQVNSNTDSNTLTKEFFLETHVISIIFTLALISSFFLYKIFFTILDSNSYSAGSSEHWVIFTIFYIPIIFLICGGFNIFGKRKKLLNIGLKSLLFLFGVFALQFLLGFLIFHSISSVGGRG